jgi:hypothetical protein
MDDDRMLRPQNANEYTFVLFFVYSRYIKINRARIENDTAVYGKMIRLNDSVISLVVIYRITC